MVWSIEGHFKTAIKGPESCYFLFEETIPLNLKDGIEEFRKIVLKKNSKNS